MNSKLLVQMGLTEKQAEVYEFLLNTGSVRLPELLKALPYKRGDMYNILEGLALHGLIEVETVGKRKMYSPAHPAKLGEVIDSQEAALKQTREQLMNSLPQLASTFRMLSNKPGIRVFEGEDASWKAMELLFEIGKPIYSFEDKGNMKPASDSSQTAKYLRMRKRRGVVDKMIVPDSNADLIAEEKKNASIELRTVPSDQLPFEIDVQICEDVVQMATAEGEDTITIHIEHPVIAKSFRAIFEYVWGKAKSTKAA